MPDDASRPANDSPAAILADLIAHLEQARRAVCAEIRAYPTPIAGCDQQFNYLLERQAATSAELARLCTGQTSSDSSAANLLTGILNSTTLIDNSTKASLLARLQSATSRHAPISQPLS